MFLTLNAMQNYLSFLCYADWIFSMNIQKCMFIVWTSYVYCVLLPNVCLQMENSVFDDGWWGITKKDSVTHRDILHIMLGRARLQSYQNTHRSTPHLEDMFLEFQMIILNSWAYLQDLVDEKHCRFSPPYGSPPSLLPYLQKQSSMPPYHYCSLLPSNNGNESWQNN